MLEENTSLATLTDSTSPEDLIGLRVASKRAFADVPVGSTGTLVEFYTIGANHFGYMVKWDHNGITDGFGKDEFNYLETV